MQHLFNKNNNCWKLLRVHSTITFYLSIAWILIWEWYNKCKAPNVSKSGNCKGGFRNKIRDSPVMKKYIKGTESVSLKFKTSLKNFLIHV